MRSRWRMMALAWRRTDPRGPEFLELAAMLRSRRPDGVTMP